MICTNRQLNHDFDDKQEDVKWEDHTGLCTLAAEKICLKTPALKPYFVDIVEDLKFTLWKCESKFDPSKGIRFSTYAMRSMLHAYREIIPLYLGDKVSRNPDLVIIKTIPMHSAMCGDKPLSTYLESPEPEPEADREELAAIIEDFGIIMEDDEADAMVYIGRTSATHVATADSGVVSNHWRCQTAKKKFKAAIEKVRAMSPEIITQTEAIIGGRAI